MKVGRVITIWCALMSLMALGIAGSAQAETAFTPPQTLDEPEPAPPQLVIDPQGRPTFLWEDLGPEGKTLLIQTLRLDATGLPGPVHTLASVPNPLSGSKCVCSKLAVDPSGRVTAVWQTITKEGKQIEAAQVNAEGVPQPARILSPPEVEGWNPQVATNADGEVAVAWNTAGAGQRVEAVQLSADGTPGEVHPLSEGSRPTIATGPDGRFYLAWSKDAVKTTRLDDEGAPEAIQTVSPIDGAASDIVVDSQGRATIAWWSGLGSYEAKAVRIESDGTPGPIRDLSPADQNVFDPRLAVDSQDRVTAVWQDFENRVFSVRLDEEGVPGAVQQLSPEGATAGDPKVAAAADGRVVVVWNYPLPFFAPEDYCQDIDLKPDGDVVRAAFIGADGQLQQVLEVSPFDRQSFGSEVALDPLGLPWVSWGTFDGTYFCPDWDTRSHFSHALLVQPPAEDPPAPPASPSPPENPPQQAATLHLAKRASAKGGRISLRARCHGPSTGTCSGRLRLMAPGLPVAHGRYRIPAGGTKTLSLPLTKAAKKALAKAEPRWLVTKARGGAVPVTTVRVKLTGFHP